MAWPCHMQAYISLATLVLCARGLCRSPARFASSAVGGFDGRYVPKWDRNCLKSYEISGFLVQMRFAYSIYSIMGLPKMMVWDDESMDERALICLHTHARTEMSANHRNKLSRLCSRTLQKWRLATIYPDSVFINTNACIYSLTRTHTTDALLLLLLMMVCTVAQNPIHLFT